MYSAMHERLGIANDTAHSGGEHLHPQDVGLYLHVPFCAKRCHFCAFYLVIQEEGRIQQFLDALEAEIAVYATQLGRAEQRVSTVYVGGGTPTVLSAVQLAAALARVSTEFSLTDDCEVTVEATPESLTSAYLDTLLEAGVTRLSLGIQTFDQHERECLGLSGTLEEAITGIRLVKQAGFTNFNVDLIYGIPGQTVVSWEQTLQQACEHEPTHLSCYALSLEKGTRFDAAFRRGELVLIEATIERQLESQATELLEVAGYVHYEISNWAKPGRACRHNRRYWQGEDYLGFGPSAQSYMAGYRFGNVSNIEQYCRRLENGELPVVERESLSILQQEKERVVFGLRLLEGVPLDWIETNKRDPSWAASFDSFLQEEYLVQIAERVILTPKGRQFADELGYQLI
jgi:oxygen-independent coproporphyrinogen-3 oxidase